MLQAQKFALGLVFMMVETMFVSSRIAMGQVEMAKWESAFWGTASHLCRASVNPVTEGREAPEASFLFWNLHSTRVQSTVQTGTK